MRALVAALAVSLFCGLLLPPSSAFAEVTPAAADQLEIWTPLPVAPRAIPAGPMEVHVVRKRGERLVPLSDVVVSASVGTIELLPSSDPFLARALFVPPPAQRGPVHLSATIDDENEPARAGSVALALDDRSMPRVQVSVDPPVLTKGRDDGEATVLVRTEDANGRAFGRVPPRLFTNTGSVTTPVQVAPGVFRARYTASGAPFPEVAVLVALLPYPHAASAAVAVGHAVLKQPAAIELPGDTKPGVLMTVEIAGEAYGPVRADDKGRFRVPVVVPPGIGAGVATSRDRIGNVKRTRVDLRLPPTRRLALAAHPRELVADGSSRALVVLTALTAQGDVLDDVVPRAEAQRGELGPLVEVSPGVFEAWYRAPLGVEQGEDSISAELPRDKTSRATLPIRLVPGPPVRLEVSVADRVVTAPSPKPTPLSLTLHDAFGNIVTEAEVRARSRHGAVTAATTSSPGTLHYISPGSARPMADQVEVHAFARARGEAVRLAFSPPSTLVAIDALGRPVPGAEVRAEGSVRYADDEGRVLLPASSGIIAVQLPGSVLPTLLHLGLGSDGQLHGAPQSPPSPSQGVQLTLAPPHDVTVEAEATAREGERVHVRYVVKGATSGKVHIFVDDKLAAEADLSEGSAWVAASPGAWVTVTHLPSGVGAAFQARGAT